MIDLHVLVVSTHLDASTDAVVAELDARGVRCTRLNSEDLPFRAGLTTRFSGATEPAVRSGPSSHTTTSWHDVSSVWYRRVRIPERPSEMHPGVYDFCLRETRAALIGSLLMQNRIMSPPQAVWAAEHKPFQLQIARSVGLVIPETVISNEPEQITAAFKRFGGRMIVKPVRSGFVDYGEQQHAVYTSQVLGEHLDHVASARWSPAIYQPLVEKECDVRVTVVGGRVFVAEIESQKDAAARIDWRRTSDPALPHRIGTLPPRVERGARGLLAALQLRFGAIDFIRTPEGEYIFLEINPNGQWLWLDDMLGLGITKAVVAWLTEPTR